MAKISNLSIDEVRNEIAELTPVLRKAFEEMGAERDASKITSFGEGLDDGQKSERLAHANVRLAELFERKAALEVMERGKAALDSATEWLETPVGPAPVPVEGRKAYTPLSQLIMKDAGWMTRPTEFDIDGKAFVDHELKTVVSTGAGFAPQAIRSGLAIPKAYQSPAVIDLVPVLNTTQSAYVFMSQTTRTNNAAEAAESADGSLVSLAESAFAWTQVSETIRKVGHFVPVTDEQLEDVPGMQDIIAMDMLEGVRQRVSSQIINGNGSAPNLSGILASGRSGVTDVNCTGLFIADSAAKLIENVQTVGFTNPDAIVMHPTDWWNYRKATTTDGIYIAGNPNDNLAPILWGVPVLLTTEIAAGKAIAGNFGGYARLAVKRGVEVSISSEHASYFAQGVKAVKAEMRAALALLREGAFAKTDDIA